MAQVLQPLRHVLHELMLPQASAPLVSMLLIIVVCPLVALLMILRRPSTAATATRSASGREQLLSKLPSPPSRLPIIGHLYLVGSLPHGSLRDLAARHGRDGLILLRLAAVSTLVVSSPLTTDRREGRRACLHACGGRPPPHSRRRARLPARATTGRRSALASPARDSASTAAGRRPDARIGRRQAC